MPGVFDDQALFNAAIARLEAKRIPEEAEPEPAVEEPDPEIESGTPDEWQLDPIRCPNFQEYYGWGPQPGSYCFEPLTKECLKCNNLNRQMALIANGDTSHWDIYECERFLEKFGFATHSDDPLHVLQDRVKNILNTLKLIIKITSLQDDL